MSRTLTYEFRVTVTQPLSADPDDADYPTLAGATAAAYRRRLERDLVADLKRLQWDADVELIAWKEE